MMMLRSSNELAEENGTPALVWMLIILALALFVGFIVWWYRRNRAGQEETSLHRRQEPEIVLPPAAPEPVPTGAAEIELPDMPMPETPASMAEMEQPDMPVFEPSDAPEPLPARMAELELPDMLVPESEAMPEIPPVDVRASEPPEVGVPVPQDDLLVIEGIGPKIASLLQAAGITTFSQLAAADVGWLREILAAASLRFADPTTWPEQARLAAAGDWAGFESLTRELRGGRRA